MRDNDNSRPAPGRAASSGARVAGIAYLITVAAGLTAEAHVRSSIRTGDPVATGEALRAFEPLYRLGILADGLMLISYVAVTALLYRLFKPVSATGSFLAALFSLVGIAMLAAALTLLVLPLQMHGPTTAQDALRAHGAVYSLTGLFFGPIARLSAGWRCARVGCPAGSDGSCW